MQKIVPFLWFDNTAEEAVKFYTSLFKKSKIGETRRYDAESAKVSGQPEGSVLTIGFELEGIEFGALNGGPLFKFSQAVSFFVNCESEKEVDELWAAFTDGGTVMMELGEYPFSKKYGWVQDKFGVSWQLMIGTQSQPGQKIVPSLLFVNELYGKGEEAVNFYLSVFPKSSLLFMSKADGSGPEPKGAVQFSTFDLLGVTFALMEGMGEHKFTFTEAISFMVNCKTQEEIDHYWNALSVDGRGQCGWLKDKYGVSWQIIPSTLDEMLADKDAAKAKRVMQAMLQMEKIDMQKLQDAYDGK